MTGMWIWPFELKEKIGEGGMGLVYKARYVKDDRMFAVKLIPANVDNKTLIARFEREIGILKTLRHPNIVRAFGGVCEDKQRFYAMELLEGGTLWDKIQKAGYLPWEKVTDWGQQMCAALTYAHERQIIHRDVKPNNFLLTKNGQVKLSDFGLISVMSDAKLTADGRTLGTVQYMSPEQIRGKPPLTGSTDIYSLGCVFYEMLTGDPPFVGENPGPILHAHLHDQPRPISEINSECPAALERLVMRMLEKDPENRPLSADDVAEQLAQIRMSPRLVQSSAASQKTTVSQVEAPEALKTAFNLAEEALKYVWAVMAALLLILASVWVIALFDGDPGTAKWIETLQSHPEPTVRVAAANAIGDLAADDDSLLDPLIETAESTSAPAEARVAALEQLSRHVDGGKSYVSRIKKLAKSDPTESIRLAAMAALNQLETPN